MARPRNQELYERISGESVRQLFAKGYTSTSYASIAKACGTSRAIVQDYFPRKMQMAFLATTRTYDVAMECTEALCASKHFGEPLLATVAHLYAAAVAYLEFMQRDAGRAAFMRDFLKDRDNTETMLFDIMARSFDAIDRIDVPEDPAYRDDLLMSMGGFHEVFYYHLKEGRPLEVQLYFSQVTRIWLRATGYPREKLDAALARFALAEDELEAALQDMERVLG